MALNVLIAPDKFKGTLTAPRAARAMATGWRKARPSDHIEQLPMSDGGDGFGLLLGEELGAEEQVCESVDAAHRPVKVSWWWQPKTRTAIVESANVIGLAMLPRDRFHPFELDTYGLGRVLDAVARKRPGLCLVGVGGSATNDAGFGMARALGWRFQDREGKAIEEWTRLTRLARIEPPRRMPPFRELVVAVDVRNKLMGKHGATRVYGPQKGIRPEDVQPAERNLKQLVKVLAGELRFPCKPSLVAGSGAAGGLGFGLLCFAGARLESGFGIFARQTNMDQRIREADLVITGEGAIDRTTIEMGKGVGQVADLCRRRRRPCIGLAGVIKDRTRQTGSFDSLHAMAPGLTSAEQAMAKPAFWLRRLAEQAARRWSQK